MTDNDREEKIKVLKCVKVLKCGCIVDTTNYYPEFGISAICEGDPLGCELQADDYCSSCGRNLYTDWKDDHEPNCDAC